MSDSDTDLYSITDEGPENGQVYQPLPDEEERPQPFGGSKDGFGKDDERKPSVHTKRASAASLISFVWGGMGMALVQSGASVPTGRVLSLQAPLAGAKLDSILMGTWLDSLLQPLVRSSEKVEGVGALVAFPLLVAMWDKNPELYPVLYPIVRKVVESNLADMAPVLKKQQADQKKHVEAVADLSSVLEGLDVPKGEDPIDALLSVIFAPVEQAPPQEPVQ